MYFHLETLPTPEENLAFDEALVEVADRFAISDSGAGKESFEAGARHEVLRLWELNSPCVVMGRASRLAEEVNTDSCKLHGVPVLRRASGGASIVAGPGCLMYSVLVSYQHRPALRALDVAHREVMSQIRDAVQHTFNKLQMPLLVGIDGTCDLTIGGRKFSGNALRCKRHWMLYHGTILVSMPLEWLSTYLREPPRQPEYREKREHGSFVTSVANECNRLESRLFSHELESSIVSIWDAKDPWQSYPWKEEVELETICLLQTRYALKAWNESR